MRQREPHHSVKQTENLKHNSVKMHLPAILSSLLLATAASAHCTRAVPQKATSAYLSAQSAGKPSTFASLTASNFTYTENFTPLPLNKSILTQPLNINRNHTYYDLTLCGTFTEVIVADEETPYVIGTRMLVVDHKVALVESVVTTTGDWAFNVTGTLQYDSMENWTRIPEAERESREAIQAVGDSYFDRFNNSKVEVPWGPPCYRLEGGFEVTGTLNGTDCEMVWPDTIVEVDRRYIIDEEYGVVDIMSGFPGLDRSQGDKPMPDSHLFRVRGGKIEFLHTVSHCVERGCGMNGTIFGRKLRRAARETAKV